MNFDQTERLAYRQQEVQEKLDILADLRTDPQAEDIWGQTCSMDTDHIELQLQTELTAIETELLEQ